MGNLHDPYNLFLGWYIDDVYVVLNVVSNLIFVEFG